MSKKTLLIIGVISIISFLLFQQYLIHKSTNREDVLLQKIELLDKKIDILALKKDSIQLIIKEVDKEIIKNNTKYEKIIDTVLAQSSSLDSCYVLDYIDRFLATKGSNYNLYRTRKIK